MSSDREFDEDDFNRIPKKHKRLRKDGEFVSQALVDKVRMYLLQGFKDEHINRVERYGVYLPNHVTTYAYVKAIVGEEASKVIKCLIDEGFVEKISYPRDETATIEVEGVLTKIAFEKDRWVLSQDTWSRSYSIFSPEKVHKSLRKYYKHSWNGWRLKVSSLSKKAMAQLEKDKLKITESIKWDEVGYIVCNNDVVRFHGRRLGILESNNTGNCPHCGEQLPFKGRHRIYSRGHDIEKCHAVTVKKILNE